MHQLLWLETLLKLAGGIALVVAPITTIKVLGLASAPNGFWPRVAGALLAGIAGAVFIEGAWGNSSGIGFAGLVFLNITCAAVIAISAVFGGGAPTRRGTFALWALVGLLFSLALAEIAYA